MPNAIPADHQTIMPYLVVENAAGFINFLKEVFDGKELNRHMRDDATIMHAEVKVDTSTIMFAEATPQFAPKTAGLFIYVDDADARYSKAIKNGASSIMPPADQSYGRSGGVTDPFGNVWWITSLQ